MYTFLLVLFFISLQSISAANISVNPGQSIQSAVDQASNGDNIIVYDNNQVPYTYKENVIINKYVNIKASGKVTIESITDNPVFYINENGAGSSIHNFTLTKSNYVIVVNNANNCIISGNKITEASLVGVQFYGNINNSKIIGNTITGADPCGGNGISFESGSSTYNNITGNIIGNFLNGILFNDNSENNYVSNNRVTCSGFTGVGIYATDNSKYMQIIGNTITGAEDGVATEQLGTDCALYYNLIGNTLTGNKNGLWVCISNSTISNNIATFNTVSGLDITGIYNRILYNTATNNGVCGIIISGLTCADHNTVSYNNINYNCNGICSGSTSSIFTYNNINYNNQTGLTITGSGCDIIENSICYNKETGLRITSTGNRIVENYLYNNLYGACFNNFNAGNFNFNSLVGNTYQVYSSDSSGTINALNNWWGSNSAPSRIYGLFNTYQWIILRTISTPTQLLGTSTKITADLTHNSAGIDISSLGHLKNGLLLYFTGTLGTITASGTTVNGKATATFKATKIGTSRISAKLTDQTVFSSTIIKYAVKSANIANNAVNISRNKIIQITFNTNIKFNSNAWIELRNSSGKGIFIRKYISKNILTITHRILSFKTWYTLIIHTGSITDLTGTCLPGYILKFRT
jgi:hypothetical protein